MYFNDDGIPKGDPGTPGQRGDQGPRGSPVSTAMAIPLLLLAFVPCAQYTMKNVLLFSKHNMQNILEVES